MKHTTKRKTLIRKPLRRKTLRRIHGGVSLNSALGLKRKRENIDPRYEFEVIGNGANSEHPNYNLAINIMRIVYDNEATHSDINRYASHITPKMAFKCWPVIKELHEIEISKRITPKMRTEYYEKKAELVEILKEEDMFNISSKIMNNK